MSDYAKLRSGKRMRSMGDLRHRMVLTIHHLGRTLP
jgi:hypothetical protein